MRYTMRNIAYVVPSTTISDWWQQLDAQPAVGSTAQS
jgi:hypothetical protein